MSDKKKILVVDDEEDQRTFMCTLLEDNGYETICAIDGEEGMDKVKEDKPDLITLDISMDNQSGIDFYYYQSCRKEGNFTVKSKGLIFSTRQNPKKKQDHYRILLITLCVIFVKALSQSK